MEPRRIARSFLFQSAPDGRCSVQAAPSETADDERLQILVFEVLTKSPFCVWPGGRALAAYCHHIREDLMGATVLELGAGCGLPGLLCAAIGASRVFLSDLGNAPLLEGLRAAALANGVGDRVVVSEHRWGSVGALGEILGGAGVDVVLAADIFFSSVDYEDAICSALSAMKTAESRLLVAYENRVATREIQYVLQKWRLHATFVPLESFLSLADDDEACADFSSISVFEITKT